MEGGLESQGERGLGCRGWLEGERAGAREGQEGETPRSVMSPPLLTPSTPSPPPQYVITHLCINTFIPIPISPGGRPALHR